MDDESNLPHKIFVYFVDGTEPSRCDFRVVLETALRLFKAARLTPNWMHTSLDRGSKIIPFRRSYKKLLAAEPNILQSLTVFEIPERFDLDYMRGFNANMVRSRHNTIDEFMFNILASLMDDNAFETACREFATTECPQYGYRFECPYHGAFAFGSRPEGAAVCNPFRAGFIEAVFGWNLLNQWHLSRQIDGTTFAKWVSASEKRGQLERYVRDSWLWTVPSDAIAGVTKSLSDAQILYDPEMHYKRWLFTTAGRRHRGDLTVEEVFNLVHAHTRKHGTPPKPAAFWQESPNHPFETDQAEVTRWLKEWGHPAGDLPDFNSRPLTPAQAATAVERSIDRAVARKQPR